MMPRLRLLALFALAGVPLVMGVFNPTVGQVGVLLTLGVFALALVDLAVSPRPSRIDVVRVAGEVLSVGAANPVRLRLRNGNASNVLLDVSDEPPAPATLRDLPLSIELSPGRTHEATYRVQPHNRGRNRFGTVFLRCASRLKLWTLCDERAIEQPVRIYPDIKAVHAVELLARRNRLAEAGVRLSRLRGRGTDFDRLREYRREDEYRGIDWKATARHQKLISREYVVERNQTILFVLDAGRSMCNERDGITHFDRALNAAVLLSYVALRQGDSVAMLICSNELRRWVPLVRGAAGVQSLVRQTYDLQPDYTASDYGLMVEQLRIRHRKRSLVVLLTHALDEVHLRAIARPLRELRRPHLVVGGFLRNVPLYERLNSIPASDLDAFQIAAAADMVHEQSLQTARLEQSGLLVLDVLPEDLSSRLITQYLEIKARHLL